MQRVAVNEPIGERQNLQILLNQDLEDGETWLTLATKRKLLLPCDGDSAAMRSGLAFALRDVPHAFHQRTYGINYPPTSCELNVPAPTTQALAAIPERAGRSNPRLELNKSRYVEQDPIHLEVAVSRPVWLTWIWAGPNGSVYLLLRDRYMNGRVRVAEGHKIVRPTGPERLYFLTSPRPAHIRCGSAEAALEQIKAALERPDSGWTRLDVMSVQAEHK